MLERKKLSAMLPKSWKKTFDNGIITKMRRFNECKGEISCTTCNNQVNENKELEANLNLIKRDTPSEYGYMLLYFIG